MALVVCPDCGSQVSDQAPQCPKCGRPIAQAHAASSKVVDETGIWCPVCKNRDSWKETQVGCLYMVFVLLTLGGALLFWPFLPRVWHCGVCKHQWRA